MLIFKAVVFKFLLVVFCAYNEPGKRIAVSSGNPFSFLYPAGRRNHFHHPIRGTFASLFCSITWLPASQLCHPFSKPLLWPPASHFTWLPAPSDIIFLLYRNGNALHPMHPGVLPSLYCKNTGCGGRTGASPAFPSPLRDAGYMPCCNAGKPGIGSLLQ